MFKVRISGGIKRNIPPLPFPRAVVESNNDPIRQNDLIESAVASALEPGIWKTASVAAG